MNMFCMAYKIIESAYSFINSILYIIKEGADLAEQVVITESHFLNGWCSHADTTYIYVYIEREICRFS